MTSPPPASSVAPVVTLGCTVPFGLVFAAAGLGCWVGGLGMCAWTQRMRAWEPVTARIVEVSAADGFVTYEYRQDGRVFAGRFRPDEDDPQQFREPGRDLAVRLHPQDASRSQAGSVRASAMPLWLGVFALSHGSVGLGLFCGGIATYRSELRRAELRRRWPAEPWKWRPDWERGHAEAESAQAASRWLWAYAAVAWNSLAWWTTALLLGESGTSGTEIAFGLAAIGAGVVPVWFAWRGFRVRWESRKWMVRFPDRGLGLGEVALLTFVDGAPRAVAVIRMDREVGGSLREWRLRCVERSVRGQGEDSVTRTRELWSGEVPVRAGAGSDTELTVRLPADGRVGVTTAWGSGDNGVRWELAALSAEGNGGERTFLLPVFRVPEGTEAGLVPGVPWPEDDAAIPEEEARAAAYATEKIGIERGPNQGRLRCAFGKRRHPMPATTSMILGLPFGGIGMVALWPFFPVPWPIRGFCALFGVAGAVLLRAALRQNFGEVVVEATPGRLVVTERCLGWTFVREWTGDEILCLEAGNAGSYNNVPFHVVQVSGRSGRNYGIPALFARSSTAQALAEDLEAVLRGRG